MRETLVAPEPVGAQQEDALAGIGGTEQMDVGLEQSEQAIGLAAGEEADMHLALRIGGPFHAQRHGIALADDRRHPRVQAVVEQVQRLHRNERLARVGPLADPAWRRSRGSSTTMYMQISSPALNRARR